MALNDELNTLFAEMTQRQRAGEARAIMQDARSTMVEADTRIQAIADEGNMNTLPTELKQALLAGWNVIKDAKTAFEDPTIAELLDWRP